MLNCRRGREGERETPHPVKKQLKPQGNQPRKFGYNGFRLLDLPTSIIINILTRTPTEGILHCRYVCKTLHSLVSDPYFVKNFITRSPFLSVVLSTNYGFNFVKLGGSPEFSCGYKKRKWLNTRFSRESRFFEIVGSCNGVICFWNRTQMPTGKLFITNPVLGEVAVLPNPSSDKYAPLEETYGFCFCPTTGQYKVIKIKVRRAYLESHQRGYYRKTEVWILNVGSDTWRYVGDAPFPQCGSFCHVLNGRLHWMVDNDHKGPISLHSLDITEERAHPVSTPPELQSENLCIKLGVLGTSLCLCDCTQNNHVEIWLMREYGVAMSWLKNYILTGSINGPTLSPLMLWTNGMILMSCHGDPIVSYDPKEGTLTKVYDFHGNGGAEVVLYTPTFLSIEHVSKGAGLRVKKVKTYHW